MFEDVYKAPATAREHSATQMHLQAAVVFLLCHVMVDTKLYKRDNVHIKVTLRRVSAIIVAVEKQ